MNAANNFPPKLMLKPCDIEPNPGQRKMFKETMCAVLGKLAQVNHKNQSRVIKSQSGLTSLFYSEEASLDNIFVVGEACIAITSAKKSQTTVSNKAASMIIYAYVTAESRIYMHKAIRTLLLNNCRVLAIFNDCLYFVSSFHSQQPLPTGKSFFTFKHEYDTTEIECFLSFGIKCNAILLTKQSGQNETVIKARGFSLKTELIKNVLTFQRLGMFFDDSKLCLLKLPQLRTRKKLKTLSAIQTVQQFKFRNNIQTENILLPDLKTLPLGTRLLKL